MDESLKNTDENIDYGTIESYVQQDGIGLALFPETTSKATARRHLMDWVKRCIPLWDELKKQGYQTGCQYFSPRQVAVIFEYLGEPDEGRLPLPG